MSSETPPQSDAIHALHAAYQSADGDMQAILPTLPEAINALGTLVYVNVDDSVDKDELAALVTEIHRHIEILCRVATTYHAVVMQIVTGVECPLPEVQSEEQLP